MATGSQLADALGLGLSPTAVKAAAAMARGIVIAEPGMLADELEIPQDVTATGFVWPCPSLDDLKTAQHFFWLSMMIAFSVTLTVTDRIPDPVALTWCGAAERSLALAIWLVERRQGE